MNPYPMAPMGLQLLLIALGLTVGSWVVLLVWVAATGHEPTRAPASGGPWFERTPPPLPDDTAEMPAPVVAEFDKLREMITAWGTEGPA